MFFHAEITVLGMSMWGTYVPFTKVKYWQMHQKYYIMHTFSNLLFIIVISTLILVNVSSMSRV